MSFFSYTFYATYIKVNVSLVFSTGGITGTYYYPDFNPDQKYRLEGKILETTCVPPNEQNPVSPTISLKEYTNEKQTATLWLCYRNEKEELEGMMNNTDGKSYHVSLKHIPPNNLKEATNVMNHIYTGKVGNLPVAVSLIFDDKMECQPFKGEYYYTTYNPQTKYRLEGACGFAICTDEVSGMPSSNLLIIKEFTKDTLTATLQLCHGKDKFQTLDGLMVNMDGKQFSVHWKLDKILPVSKK